MKRLRRKCFSKSYLALAFLLLIFFYTEFLTYYLNTYNWNEIVCKNEELCTKIILVADPQIIGKQNELIHFLTPLSIWDSDRFLYQTYHKVFNFIRPSIVIFLGDLFDEGSVSSNLDFQSYVARLHNIFHTVQNSAIQYIWLPGDNDIGGEGMDIITAKKTDKFNQAFIQSDTIQYKNITFYKINKLLHYIPARIDNNVLNVDITIGLSHVPILTSYSTFADEVLGKLQPSVLFTAHEHKSKVIFFNTKNKDDRRIVATYPKSANNFEFKLGKDYVYEIIVPTCSYRMGTMNMGYGYAVIERDTLQYTVLWSPTRFPTLIFYCILLVLLICVLFVKLCFKLIRCCKWPCYRL